MCGFDCPGRDTYVLGTDSNLVPLAGAVLMRSPRQVQTPPPTTLALQRSVSVHQFR